MSAFRPSRRAFALGALASPAVLASPAFAQADAAADLGRELTALFDPAAPAAVRAEFWRTRLSQAGRTAAPLDAFEAQMRGVADLTGGVDLLEVRHIQEGPRAQRAFLMQARRQGTNRWVRAVPDREESDRLFEVPSIPRPALYDRDGPAGSVSREELAAEIGRRVRYAVDRDDFAGAVLVAAPDGEIVWQGAVGLADRGANRAATLLTPFHLGSADKSFTALIIGRLIREGRLGFDTRLIDVLPDYPNVAFARACTIDHLLTHSSGLGGLFDRAAYDVQKRYEQMADLFPAFAAEAPAWTPGERAGYSNEGYVVLGAVAEAVTDRSWYDLLDEQVYRPAGMTDSGHLRRNEAIDRKAVGYTFPETDRLGFGPRVRNDHIVGYRGNSCGGGYSTVGDMTRYLRALRSGELMPAAQLAAFVAAAPGGLRQYGRGFQVRPAGGRTLVGHGGGGPRSGIDGYHAVVWETGWTLSVLGANDAPFSSELARDIGHWLAFQDG